MMSSFKWDYLFWNSITKLATIRLNISYVLKWIIFRDKVCNSGIFLWVYVPNQNYNTFWALHIPYRPITHGQTGTGVIFYIQHHYIHTLRPYHQFYTNIPITTKIVGIINYQLYDSKGNRQEIILLCVCVFNSTWGANYCKSIWFMHNNIHT